MRSVAEASILYTTNGKWYLNRVLVGSPEMRGKGLGSKLVARLLEVLCEREDFRALIVEPGGYGSDPAQLQRFYLRCGFKTCHVEGALVWRRPPQAPLLQEVHTEATIGPTAVEQTLNCEPFDTTPVARNT
jgi:GNAT superfamily N-acetyltransferase